MYLLFVTSQWILDTIRLSSGMRKLLREKKTKTIFSNLAIKRRGCRRHRHKSLPFTHILYEKKKYICFSRQPKRYAKAK